MYAHREPYQFMLPAYMVHESYNPHSATQTGGQQVCPPAPSGGVPYSKPAVLEADGMCRK